MLGNNLYFISSVTSRTDNGFDTAAYIDMTTSMYHGNGLYHDSYGSSAYALTSDGGVAHIGSMSVNYANSAGSVAWGNVSGRPTNVSSFTNDSGYITSSGSCAYATSAGTANDPYKLPVAQVFEAQNSDDNPTWGMTYAESHRQSMVYNTSGVEWAYWIGMR